MNILNSPHRIQILPVAAKLYIAACVCATLLFCSAPAHAYDHWWVQNHMETQLWSGPEKDAVSLRTLPQWTYLQVVSPQTGLRLQVLDTQTGNRGYVDANSVGPSGPRPQATVGPSLMVGQTTLPRTAPVLPGGYQAWWVSNFVATTLWSDPNQDGTSICVLLQFRRLMVVEPQDGSRLHVWLPDKNILGYVDAVDVGPTGSSVWMTARQPRVTSQVHLPGRSVGDRTYIRNLPVLDDETKLLKLPHNSPVYVRAKVVAADGTTWYTIGDGGYLLASKVRLPSPPGQQFSGKWISVELREPTLVTAYEGNRVVYSALAIKGTDVFSTPRGTFQILRRVENETMDSETLLHPIPHGAPGSYHLENVLYTQYFTPGGASFHYNWWLGTFGYAGSHGCLGLDKEDARWFWEWASVGTPVVIR